MKIKLSRSQWEGIGKKAGWMKEAQLSSLSLPTQFIRGLSSFPESSMGAVTVRLELGNGQKVNDVVVDQEGKILFVGGRKINSLEDLGFNPSDIINVF